MKVKNVCNYPRGIAGVVIEPGEEVKVSPGEDVERVIRSSNDFSLFEEEQNQVEQVEEEDDE